MAKQTLEHLVLAVLLTVNSNVQAQFTFTTNNETITVTGYTGSGGAVVIPAETDGFPVTSIGIYAFMNRDNVTSVTIPNTIIDIGFGAFNHCRGLSSVTIPAGVTTIQEQAFAGCSSLTNVTMLSGVKSIGTAAFFDCSSLADVAIPNSVTNIEDGAFSFCGRITSISIPGSVRSVGSQAFSLCYGLTNVTIPSSVTRIEGDSFYACARLQAFDVDALNPAYTSKDGVLFNKNLSLLVACPSAKSGSYAIPAGVTSIGDFAFAVCRYLTKLDIPNSVTNIGCWAFSQCESVRSLTIPKSVTYIGDMAFQDCTGLRQIYFQGNAPGVGSRIFIGDYYADLYYLPETAGWNEFLPSNYLSGILWNPRMQIKDGGFGVRTNGFGFNITGTTNIPIVVETTTHLTDSVWVTIQSGMLTNGSIYFKDSQWTNFPTRFYRIRSP